MHRNYTMRGTRNYFATIDKATREFKTRQNPETGQMEFIPRVENPSDIPEDMRSGYNTIYISEIYYDDENNKPRKYYVFYSPNGKSVFYSKNDLGAGLINTDLKMTYDGAPENTIQRIYATDTMFNFFLTSLLQTFHESPEVRTSVGRTVTEYFLEPIMTDYYDGLIRKKSVSNLRKNMTYGIFIDITRYKSISPKGTPVTKRTAQFKYYDANRGEIKLEEIDIKNMAELDEYIIAASDRFFKYITGRKMRDSERGEYTIDGETVKFDRKGKELRYRRDEAKFGKLFYVTLDKIKNSIPEVDRRHTPKLTYLTIKDDERYLESIRNTGIPGVSKKQPNIPKEKTIINISRPTDAFYLTATTSPRKLLSITKFINEEGKININKGILINIEDSKKNESIATFSFVKSPGHYEAIAKLKIKGLEDLRPFMTKYYKNLFRVISGEEVVTSASPNTFIEINGNITPADINNPPQTISNIISDRTNHVIPLDIPIEKLTSKASGMKLRRSNIKLPKTNIRQCQRGNINCEIKNINNLINRGKITNKNNTYGVNMLNIKINSGIKIGMGNNLKIPKVPTFKINSFSNITKLQPRKNNLKQKNTSYGDSILKNYIRIGGLKRK